MCIYIYIICSYVSIIYRCAVVCDNWCVVITMGGSAERKGERPTPSRERNVKWMDKRDNSIFMSRPMSRESNIIRITVKIL